MSRGKDFRTLEQQVRLIIFPMEQVRYVYQEEKAGPLLQQVVSRGKNQPLIATK